MKKFILAGIFILTFIFLFSCSISKVTITKPAPKILETDITEMHGEVENAERLDLFVEQVNKNVKDKVRLVRYTIEGDPIFQILDYNGEKLILTIDASHDQYGQGGKTKYECKGIKKTETDVETQYFLTGCPNNEIGNLLTISYDTEKEDYFGFRLKFGQTKKHEINTKEQSVTMALPNGDYKVVKDFQLSRLEMNQIYKYMLFSNYLGEKKFSSNCGDSSEKPYELTVWINDATREFNWKECDKSKDGKKMTKLANEIITILKKNPVYKELLQDFSGI